MTCFALGAKWARPGSAGFDAGAAARALSPSRGVSAAPTNCGSLRVTSAWSGVLVRSRRTVQNSRLGALKISIDAGGAARFQKVYRLRRGRFLPGGRLFVRGVFPLI